jgi:hypothetical protein
MLTTLGLLENTSGLLLLSSSVGIASPGPCLLLVKIEAPTDILSLLDHVFLEARATVDRFAYSRLERHHGSLAAITTLSLKHPFLERTKSPRLAPD